MSLNLSASCSTFCTDLFSCQTYCDTSRSNLFPYRPPQTIIIPTELPEEDPYYPEYQEPYVESNIEERELQVTICTDMDGDYFCTDLPSPKESSLVTICDYDDLAGYICTDM